MAPNAPRKKTDSRLSADFMNCFDELLQNISSEEEGETLIRIAIRAGMLWHCYSCKYDNWHTNTSCEDCGKLKKKSIDYKNLFSVEA